MSPCLLTQFAISACVKLAVINVSAHLSSFTASTWRPESSRTCISCAHRHDSRAGRNCRLSLVVRDSHFYIDSQLGKTHCITNFRTYSTSIECPTRRSILELLSLDHYSVLIIQLKDILQTFFFRDFIQRNSSKHWYALVVQFHL